LSITLFDPFAHLSMRDLAPCPSLLLSLSHSLTESCCYQEPLGLSLTSQSASYLPHLRIVRIIVKSRSDSMIPSSSAHSSKKCVVPSPIVLDRDHNLHGQEVIVTPPTPTSALDESLLSHHFRIISVYDRRPSNFDSNLLLYPDILMSLEMEEQASKEFNAVSNATYVQGLDKKLESSKSSTSCVERKQPVREE
ncbi:hypothetical protein PENTCL1PPCAC_27883, partial [Pristionchus entomophagus]